MQGLWTEDDINLRSSGPNSVPFLGGHTTTDGNHQIGVLFLQLFPAPELVEQFLLGFFPDRAGVEHQNIGLFGQLGGLVALRGS